MSMRPLGADFVYWLQTGKCRGCTVEDRRLLDLCRLVVKVVPDLERRMVHGFHQFVALAARDHGAARDLVD